MYLSLQDVIVGAAIGVILIPIMMPYVEFLDRLQATNVFGSALVIVAGSFLLYIYPNPPEWNTAKGDTATVVSVGSGISVGTWVNYHLGYVLASEAIEPLQIPAFNIWWLILALTRSVIGVSILVIVRSIIKPVSIVAFSKLYNVDVKDVDTQRKMGMEKPQKYVAYFIVAFCAVYLVPYVLRYLGLMRMSFYSEYP